MISFIKCCTHSTSQTYQGKPMKNLFILKSFALILLISGNSMAAENVCLGGDFKTIKEIEVARITPTVLGKVLPVDEVSVQSLANPRDFALSKDYHALVQIKQTHGNTHLVHLVVIKKLMDNFFNETSTTIYTHLGTITRKKEKGFLKLIPSFNGSYLVAQHENVGISELSEDKKDVSYLAPNSEASLLIDVKNEKIAKFWSRLSRDAYNYRSEEVLCGDPVPVLHNDSTAEEDEIVSVIGTNTAKLHLLNGNGKIIKTLALGKEKSDDSQKQFNRCPVAYGSLASLRNSEVEAPYEEKRKSAFTIVDHLGRVHYINSSAFHMGPFESSSARKHYGSWDGNRSMRQIITFNSSLTYHVAPMSSYGDLLFFKTDSSEGGSPKMVNFNFYINGLIFSHDLIKEGNFASDSISAFAGDGLITFNSKGEISSIAPAIKGTTQCASGNEHDGGGTRHTNPPVEICSARQLRPNSYGVDYYHVIYKVRYDGTRTMISEEKLHNPYSEEREYTKVFGLRYNTFVQSRNGMKLDLLINQNGKVAASYSETDENGNDIPFAVTPSTSPFARDRFVTQNKSKIKLVKFICQ